MILGSKPIAEMTAEELQAAVEELRASREALRAEAIAKKAKGEPVAKQPRVAKVKVVDPVTESILKDFLS